MRFLIVILIFIIINTILLKPKQLAISQQHGIGGPV